MCLVVQTIVVWVGGIGVAGVWSRSARGGVYVCRFEENKGAVPVRLSTSDFDYLRLLDLACPGCSA